MKKALKIIISLILIVAILGAGWYFLGYKMLLSRDFFISQGDRALASGNTTSAVRNYQQAWDRSPDHPETALALADAYIASGNYTKAEYTLVSSITAYPEVLDLYIALSQTYVEQDKLLDAANMLNRVSNETVQAQLDEMRPAAPVISPDSGYYNDQIEVSLTYGDGTAYLSIDGDFPSTASNLYTDPISLPSEESTVTAIAVGDNGLVSATTVNGYTVGGIIEGVTFRDAAVEAAVREVLAIESGTDILTSDMWNLTQLEVPSDVETLADLAICRNLTHLTVHEVYGMDFSILSEIPSLQVLDLSNSTVSTKGITAIGALPNLTSLNLASCGVTDISALSAAVKLTHLDLSENVIEEISSLSSLANLTILNLSTNKLMNIDPLAALTNLRELDVSNNVIVSLSSLESKANLERLDISDNQVIDLAPLASCNNLSYFMADYNNIDDLSPIADKAKLTDLGLSYNQVEELPDLSALANLHNLDLSYNQISSIDTLGTLDGLNKVVLDSNKITDLLPLLDCMTLVEVSAYGNEIADVEPLLEMYVVVRYDPTYVAPEEETNEETTEE